MTEIERLKAEIAKLHSELDKRNEATKVWIQADTQTRSYACELERDMEVLLGAVLRSVRRNYLPDVQADLRITLSSCEGYWAVKKMEEIGNDD